MGEDIERICDRIARSYQVDLVRLKQMVRNHGVNHNGPEAIVTLLANMLRDSAMRRHAERMLGELRDETVKKFNEYRELQRKIG